MQCYATENHVKQDFTLHRSTTKRCTESMKDKFLASVLFKLLGDSNLKGSTKNSKNLDDLLIFGNEFSNLSNIPC